MANDVVALLRSSNAWVDSNLIALVSGGIKQGDGESKRKSRKRDKNKTGEAETVDCNAVDAKKKKSDANDMLVMEDSEDEFADLAPNRIVLKRASHVVDSDEEDDGGS